VDLFAEMVSRLYTDYIAGVDTDTAEVVSIAEAGIAEGIAEVVVGTAGIVASADMDAAMVE
jgi:hypothetical protein